MKVALYARVSTRDKEQNPETQLLPLREFVRAQGWTAVGEFVDKASGGDLGVEHPVVVERQGPTRCQDESLP